MDRFDNLVAAIAQHVGTDQFGSHVAVSSAVDLVGQHWRGICTNNTETTRSVRGAAEAILESIAFATIAAQRRYQAGRMFGLDHRGAVSSARNGLAKLLFDSLGENFQAELSAGWDHLCRQEKTSLGSIASDAVVEKSQAATLTEGGASRYSAGAFMVTIAEIASDFGAISILRSKIDGSCIYAQGDGYQSHADRNGVSLSYYIHAMYGFVAQARAREVLMIGCAGGTLGTMLANVGVNVTIVDINSESFVLARQYFSLSPLIMCHVADGSLFLERSHRSYDVIIIDAFASDKIPEHLRSVKFFQLARRHLNDSGSILVNTLIYHDLDPTADEIAASLATTGMSVQILETPGEVDRNAIVVGSSSGSFAAPAFLAYPEIQQRKISDEVGKMRFRPWRKRPRPTPW